MLYAKLIGRIALFTCANIAHIEFYLQGILPKILAIYTIKLFTALVTYLGLRGIINNKWDSFGLISMVRGFVHS